jgi:uncharacterized protein YbjT (DUF2867 family)
MSTIVITGIGGVQQTAIAEAFRAAGWTVRGTSRTASPGVAAANLETGEGLAAAFAGADVVAFTLPQAHQPGVTGRMAASVARAASEAGVGRVVLNIASRVAEGSPAGIFRAMAAARDTIASGPVPSVVLQPTVFMENLAAPWSIEGILNGTVAYPAPESTRVAWLSHRALAEAVVAAATRDVAGQTFRIGGPEALSGADLAATLSAHLGRPVGYYPIPVEGFRDTLNQMMGTPAGDRIGELYAHLARHPDFLSDGADDMARLGVVPEPFAAFVARTRWQA